MAHQKVSDLHPHRNPNRDLHCPNLKVAMLNRQRGATNDSTYIFNETHELFRQSTRQFMETEVAPHHHDWEKVGMVPRELWKKAVTLDFCVPMPRRRSEAQVVTSSLMSLLGRSSVASVLQGQALPSIQISSFPISYITARLRKRRWIPPMIRGCHHSHRNERAQCRQRPSEYPHDRRTRWRRIYPKRVKTFITNGQLADLVSWSPRPTRLKEPTAHPSF